MIGADRLCPSMLVAEMPTVEIDISSCSLSPGFYLHPSGVAACSRLCITICIINASTGGIDYLRQGNTMYLSRCSGIAFSSPFSVSHFLENRRSAYL